MDHPMSDISTKDFVAFLVKALVDDTASVVVSEVAGIQTDVIEVQVARGDVGKVIGRQGKTADAIRHLVACVAAKGSRRCILQINDP